MSTWEKLPITFIRYADDFVITGATKETLEKTKLIIDDFLKDRGLSLSEEKTKIVHIDEGFDFLGWNVRKYGGKLLIKQAKKNVQAFLRKIRQIIKENHTAKAVDTKALDLSTVHGILAFQKVLIFFLNVGKDGIRFRKFLKRLGLEHLA